MNRFSKAAISVGAALSLFGCKGERPTLVEATPPTTAVSSMTSESACFRGILNLTDLFMTPRPHDTTDAVKVVTAIEAMADRACLTLTDIEGLYVDLAPEDCIDYENGQIVGTEVQVSLARYGDGPLGENVAVPDVYFTDTATFELGDVCIDALAALGTTTTVG